MDAVEPSPAGGPDVTPDGGESGASEGHLSGHKDGSAAVVDEPGRQEGVAVDSTADATSAEPDPIWLCLSCGRRSCGRATRGAHALDHASVHRIVLCVQTLQCWYVAVVRGGAALNSMVHRLDGSMLGVWSAGVTTAMTRSLTTFQRCRRFGACCKACGQLWRRFLLSVLPPMALQHSQTMRRFRSLQWTTLLCVRRARPSLATM
jgi:hypothetical protein